MKRNFIVLLAVLTLLPALSACSGQPQSATTPGPTPAAAPTPALVETAEPAEKTGLFRERRSEYPPSGRSR